MINHKSIELWAFSSYTHIKSGMLECKEMKGLDSYMHFQNSDNVKWSDGNNDNFYLRPSPLPPPDACQRIACS